MTGITRIRAACLVFVSVVVVAASGPALAQYLLKTDEDLRRHTTPIDRDAASIPAPLLNPACGPNALAWLGQPVPGGGYLQPSYGACVSPNASGRIAFYADVTDSGRNQGIFVADSAGLHPIARGCGGWLGSGNLGSGCGDPSPIGGTFAGFDPSSAGTPVLNDAGDVLFLADVRGGSSRRGLFLYRGATGQIVKVAALGDVVLGAPLAAVGWGSLNNRGEVVFHASYVGANEHVFILRWRDGELTVVAAPGDPLPGGSSIYTLVWLGSYDQDGTYLPYFEVPDINDEGAVAFLAYLSGGTYGGLFVWREGTIETYVSFGDPTPAGGSFFALYAPILNNKGEIAFQGEYLLEPWTVGWFVGRPGKWRHVVSFYDLIEGGQSWGLAVSHNPQQPLDDDGNLLVWTDVKFTETVSIPYTLMGHADGRLETLARAGDPGPFGTTLGPMNAWPSLHDRRAYLGSFLANWGSAHLQYFNRPAEVTGLVVAPDPAPGVRLTWDPQITVPPGIVHDVMRGRLSGLVPPAPSECAASDVSGTTWVEPDAECAAPPGDGCWYLVRGEDTCGSGAYGAGKAVCLDACAGTLIPGCPVCGDGAIDGSEECDGAALGGGNCQSLGYDGGTLACTASCTLDPSGCTTICGDGIVRGDEVCDSTNLRGNRCVDLGYDDGILSCGNDCTWDVSACCCTDGTPGCPVCPVCGNNVREAPFELCDGDDLGGETCWSQGHLPGLLLCKYTCKEFNYMFCTGD